MENALIRQHIAPILDKYNVPLVLNGHEHSYQRSVPIRGGAASDGGAVYITTGGGGADLHRVTPSALIARSVSEHHYLRCAIDGETLTIEALRADGSLLDSWKLAPRPAFAASPVVDSASFGTRLAAGGLATIFGHQLAPTDFAPGLPLPRETAGCSVTWNGKPLPLLMTSPTQINVQLPYETGQGTLAVHGPNGTIERKITIGAAAPAIFDGAIFGPTGQITTDAPAHAGDTISIYATGLGAPTDERMLGALSAPIEVEWNGVKLSAQSATLASGIPGVSVVTFQIPKISPANSTLRIVAEGQLSNAVQIATE
jgi:uncharacterized protein (TIGR03437 family)